MDETDPSWRGLSGRAMLLSADLRRLRTSPGPISLLTAARAGSSAVVVPGVCPEEASLAGLPAAEAERRRAGLGTLWRMSLTPGRNVGWAAWHTAWNVAVGGALATTCLAAFPVHGWRTAGAAGLLTGTARGVSAAGQYVLLGCVASPAVHAACGLRNTAVGLRNIFRSDRTFDPVAGRYVAADIEVNRAAAAVLMAEAAQRCVRGEAEVLCKRRRAMAAHKGKFGFSGMTQDAAGGGGSGADDHYGTLGVAPEATAVEVKRAYQRLAKAYHPDANPDPAARERFDRIQAAYRVLSDPAQRKAYDAGGVEGLKVAQTQGAQEVLKGSPADVMQRVYGGAPFEALVFGKLYRSPHHMKTQATTAVTLHDMEVLQTARMRLLTPVLADILDVHAMDGQHLPGLVLDAVRELGLDAKDDEEAKGGKKIGVGVAPNAFSSDFKARVERYAKRLARCSFGPELAKEVGDSYVVNARRYLGHAHMMEPRALTSRKIGSGFGRMWATLWATEGLSKQGPSQSFVRDLVRIEWDNAVCDMHVIVRFAAMAVCNDQGLSKRVAARITPKALQARNATVAASLVVVATPQVAEGKHRGPKAAPEAAAAAATSPQKAPFAVKPSPEGAAKKIGEQRLRAAQAMARLDEFQREAVLAHVAANVRERRLSALLHLGGALQAVGKPFGERTTAQLTEHIRTVTGAEANTTVPPAF